MSASRRLTRVLDEPHAPVRVAGIACLVLLLGTSGFFVGRLMLQWQVLPDFTIFWTAAQNPWNAYEQTALTVAQSFVVAPSHGLRPFVYPPTALLVVLPFGLLTFWAAYWSWLTLSSVAFWTASRQITTGRNSFLALATPHSVLVLILGQTTLLIGAAIIWALALLRTKPLTAGVLLGVAAAIKPQSLMLVPLALISGRHWRSLAGAAAGFTTAAVASLVLGPDLWLDWWKSLRSFPALLDSYNLDPLGATPWMAGHALDFGSASILLFQAAGIAVGCVVVWRAFYTSADPQPRLIALVVGTLLASPYAMRYELAMLAPALVPALLSGRIRGLAIAAPLFAMNATVAVFALLISGTVRTLTLPAPLEAHEASTGTRAVALR